jgi:ribonuclease D
MFEGTPLVMVEDFDTLKGVAEKLEKSPIIGIDTEGDSFYHYREKVCLIQFSDEDQDYIVDPLMIDDLSPLKSVLENPNIIKILHGADYDIVCLKRDFGFQLRGVFDTLVAAQLIGVPKFGLGDLVQTNFQFTMDKIYQRHNWSKRPLLQEHLDYARGDTHFLIRLREILLSQVEKLDRTSHLVEECALLEQREWQGRVFDPNGYLKVKGANKLSDEQLRIVRRLYLFRDEQAKSIDRPAFKIFPDRAIIDIAIHQPCTDAQLEKLFTRQRPMRHRYGKAMVAAVLDGLTDTHEIPKPSRQNSNPPPYTRRLKGRAAERMFQHLKTWRNEKIESNPIYTSYTVIANATLKAIAEIAPRDLEELAKVPNIRQWQQSEFGQELLEALKSPAAQD